VAIKNREEGKAEGKAESLIFMLEKRFQPISEQQKALIFSLNDEQIMTAMEFLFQLTSLQEMFAQIDK
jgi:hypothetical protein